MTTPSARPPAPAESPLPASCRLTTTQAGDADEHAHNLSRWNQRYDQLSCGSFAGSVTELWLPETQIFVERANRALRQSCAAWNRSIWFGIPAPQPGAVSLGGHAVAENAVCVRRGGAEFELLTAPDFDLFGVVIDGNAFAAYLDAAELPSLEALLGKGDVITLPEVDKQSVCTQLRVILSDAGRTGQAPAELQSRIFASMATMLAQAKGDLPAHALTRLRRQRLVEQVRTELLAHPELPPSVPELCQRLHLSRRALQNCFHDMTGMAPLAYMRTIRLNGVRRQLRQGDPRPLGDIAFDWGFEHPSQFAQDYRKLFGELPSSCRDKR